MGNQASQRQVEAQSIISRVWDDDPSTKNASIEFAQECMIRIMELLRQREALHSCQAEKKTAVDKETQEVLQVLDSYLDNMVEKLYLQYDKSKQKFDHPLLFRFWRYDENKGEYCQTKSGRGLSICQGVPRAENVLKSQALLEELDSTLSPRDGLMAHPKGDIGDDITPSGTLSRSYLHRTNSRLTRTNTGSRSITRTPTNSPNTAGGSAASPSTNSNPTTPTSHSSRNGSSNSNPTTHAPTPEHSLSSTTDNSSNVAGATNTNNSDTNTNTMSNEAGIEEEEFLTPSRRRSEPQMNASNQQQVALAFRGQMLHPKRALFDINPDGGVLDLILLRPNEPFCSDLIDDSQVRMLSAHSCISNNAHYLDMLYTLATRSVALPRVETQMIHQRAKETRSARWRHISTGLNNCLPRKKHKKHGYHDTTPYERYEKLHAERIRRNLGMVAPPNVPWGPKDCFSCVSGKNIGCQHPFFGDTSAAELQTQTKFNNADTAHTLPHENSSFAKRIMSKMTKDLPNFMRLTPSPKQDTRNMISEVSWSILTSFRNVKCHARLLTDLFEEARLEMEQTAKREKRQLYSREDLQAGPGTVVSYTSLEGTAMYTIQGGLPRDLADLIDSYMPNKVQTMVMAVDAE